MADRSPYVRHGRSAGARRAAALGGLLIGMLVLAVVAWQASALVGGEGGEEAAPSVESTPPKPTLKIVFPEGFTRKQMAERIAAVNRIAKEKRDIAPSLSPKDYLRATTSTKLPRGFGKAKAPHLEGFLFPATYTFTEDTTSQALLRQQLETFEVNWDKLDLAYAKSKNLTPYDVVIIASMVEKEVQVPRERPLVAAVIYNRLREGLPLGIDATIRYGYDIPATEPILLSQLESDHPYNTRRRAGLTPTPIANPGLASLQAAAHPAGVRFLYFIRKADCKSHFFTASEQEFDAYPRAGLQC